jgi:hypothetical protein
MIRYKPAELLNKIIVGDSRSPLSETAYMRSARRKIFWGALMVGIVFAQIMELVLPLIVTTIWGALTPANAVANFAHALGIMLVNLVQVIVYWWLVSKNTYGWRKELLPQVVAASNSLESILFFPSRSLLARGSS